MKEVDSAVGLRDVFVLLTFCSEEVVRLCSLMVMFPRLCSNAETRWAWRRDSIVILISSLPHYLIVIILIIDKNSNIHFHQHQQHQHDYEQFHHPSETRDLADVQVGNVGESLFICFLI